MYITSLKKKARSHYQSAYCPVFSLKSFSCLLTMDTPTCLCLTSSLVCSELDSLQLSVLSKQCNKAQCKEQYFQAPMQIKGENNESKQRLIWNTYLKYWLCKCFMRWKSIQQLWCRSRKHNVCVCAFQPRFQTKTIFVSFLVSKVFQISHFVQQKAKKSQKILWWFKNKQNKWAVE